MPSIGSFTLVSTSPSPWPLAGPLSLSSTGSSLACFISAASALLHQPCVPHSCFSQAPLLVVTLPFTKPLKLVHLSVRFCSAWTGCVSIGLFPFLDVVEGNVSQLWVSACWEWGHPLGLCRALFNEALSVSHWENSTKSVHHHCNS